MIAISSWITGKYKTLIWSSAAAVLIFRSELVIYLGIIFLIELFYKRLTVLRYVDYFLTFLNLNFDLCLED